MTSVNTRQEAIRAIAGAEYQLQRVNFTQIHIKEMFGEYVPPAVL